MHALSTATADRSVIFLLLKMSLLKTTLRWLPLFLIIACVPEKQAERPIDTPQKDTIAAISNDAIVTETPIADDFLHNVNQFAEDFSGYKLKSAQVIDTVSNPAEHWFISSLERSRSWYTQQNDVRGQRALLKLPTKEEINQIGFIRQGALYQTNPSSHDVLFEEWHFESNYAAERWLVLLKDSLRGNEFTKPPRFQWVEDNRLLLVATKSAATWFELADTLTASLTGKTRSQLNALYHPLDLSHFKKWQGPSNSGIAANKYLYVDPAQQHYRYFLFQKHMRGRPTPTEKAFHITTSLHHPLTGNEKYESIEETLVGIQCEIKDSGLSIDLMDKSEKELSEMLGEVLYEADGHKVYGHFNRIYAVGFTEGRVSRFKYMRLKKAFDTYQDDPAAMNEILSWNP